MGVGCLDLLPALCLHVAAVPGAGAVVCHPCAAMRALVTVMPAACSRPSSSSRSLSRSVTSLNSEASSVESTKLSSSILLMEVGIHD